VTLRTGVLYALAALLVVALISALTGHRGWFFVIESVVAAGMIVFELSRYRATRSASEIGFQPTAERFIDPASGRMTTVYYDAKTGERDYRD